MTRADLRCRNGYVVRRAGLGGGLSVNALRGLDFSDGIHGRAAIIVDGSNVFLAGREREFRIDFGAVRRVLGGNALMMAKFVGSRSSYCRPSQEGFFRYLCRTGWELHKFDLLIEGGAVAEDELAVDGEVRAEVRKAANRADIDSIVLLSGDGGMTNAVRYARDQGKDVFVVAWEGTLHPALATKATDVAFIDDLRPLIARFH